MSAETTVRKYYAAVRNGDPLGPYFADHPAAVKFGISEQLRGFEEITEALAEQTRTTEEWRVESTDLTVTEQESHAWFADFVDMAWTDTGTGERFSFESRWSGTLETQDGDWQFVSMHVSAPWEL
ncbi:nuclear transport factor 2 family protein [Natranaeroarchaeum aerophilus]|uniref:Nuclear transport factor 2 family protein n=1 Tax=Natranaeroarchaeum aerophilus TaxID=2917711 RepID=A0AAE3FQH5_9EURY|nr:nuclear transport factor 2 family protein [Natranaeroarchaeum aerophilus]MCL9813722.1 nuclear transport factor 2 family protein [Natranaeroarchaeum aerophilus]